MTPPMKHAVDVSVWLLLCSGMLAAACGDGGAPPSSAPEASPVDARAETDAKAEADARAKAEADARAKAEADARAKAEADARAKAEAAEAEATMKILEAAKAAADAHAKPGTLFDALRWADKDEGGRSTIDVIETFGPPDEPDLVLRLAEVYDGPDGIATALPPEAPLPPGFALEDEWLVITTAGARRGKATAFGAYFGASESHFIVVLDVEATGLAVPARRWKGRVPKLRKAKAIDLRTPEAQEWLALVGPAIAASASDGKSTKVLTSKPLTPKTTRVVEGRFPGGFTRLVSIAMPVRRVTRIGEEHVAGLVLADDTGRVEAVHAPGLTLDSYDVSFLVDLEGDGQDEVIYESSYYEGNYRLVLAWNAAGTALHRSLGGDGA